MASPTKTVLITGASSGIGEATARRLALRGYNLVIGARRVDRLAALAGELLGQGAGDGDIGITTAELDVTDRASVQEFVDLAMATYGRVDVLINNAGVMPLSEVAELRVEEWEQMIDVNFRGVLYGVAAVLPHMKEQSSGHVVNLLSTAGHRVDPTAAVYSATKFAVDAFSQGLRMENDDIRVTVVTPGYTRTDLANAGGNDSVRAAVRAATDEIGLDPSVIADAIAYAIDQPEEVDVNEIILRSTVQR